jgi:hypothetical protein
MRVPRGTPALASFAAAVAIVLLRSSASSAHLTTFGYWSLVPETAGLIALWLIGLVALVAAAANGVARAGRVADGDERLRDALRETVGF